MTGKPWVPTRKEPMRRAPRQDRSRAMVERIVTAGREILLERGYERTSTSRIAARAGISPGSLYQYFPNKESILDRVVEVYAEQLRARISHAFVANLGTSVPEMVRANIVALLDALEEDSGLLRVLYQLPETVDVQRAGFERHIDELVTATLATLLPRLPGEGAAPEPTRGTAGTSEVAGTPEPAGTPETGRDVAADGSARTVGTVAWILVRTVEHVTVRYVLDQPPIPRAEIVEELTAMIAIYLRQRV
ncbi:DNA-binding transcriptional regulator, AcrR family [Parafrankia irregularis]|uniref:DNA-binding transcriptional regulator, AcrR family n=1 Tax=Parafrankia irregularis TaxID=795642 RepID=A0A0S4QUB2_9ACTN|nr:MULTISPECIES: TetR/AcrR family transcriptional regulator [Parafrankia]CUU58042.1 DNA-binding transcriptional regulator, AcrR family [Parafrankia irregularis]